MAQCLVSLNVEYGALNNKLLPIEKIMDDVISGKLVFEMLGFGYVKPYYDFEVPYKSLKELNDEKGLILMHCRAALNKIFGNENGLEMYDASGMKNGEAFLSFHFVKNGSGCYRSGSAIMDAGLVPPPMWPKSPDWGWDRSVYKDERKYQLFRMLGASKPRENRPFVVIDDKNNELRFTLAELAQKDRAAALALFGRAMIQDTDGETLIAVQKKKPEVIETKHTPEGEVVVIGTNGAPLGKDIAGLTADRVRALTVIAKWNEQKWDWDTWIKNMWELRNIANEFNLDLRQLAHDVSKVHVLYRERTTDKAYDVSRSRDLDDTRKHLGHLRKEAKLANPDAYVAWIKPLRDEADKADPMYEKIKNLDWNDSLLGKYKATILGEGLKWVKLMRSADKHEFKINEFANERIAKMKANHLPVNRRFYISDKKLFHKAYLKSDALLKQFTEDTLAAVVNGGETIWITADFVESHKATYIKQLETCPMSHKSEVILVNKVNCCWIDDMKEILGENPEAKSDVIMAKIAAIKFKEEALHEFAQEYRKVNYAQLTGYFPYLTDAQKPKPSEIFNLFGGFKYQYEPRETKFKFKDYPQEIAPFVRHVYDILANGNEHIGNYLMVWFAFLLQHPNRKPEMALFFISIEGAGKGVIFEMFARYVMGEEHYAALNKIDDLIGHFNSHLEGKRLITVAETKDGDLANKETHRALKSAITDERTEFTKKCKDTHMAMAYWAVVLFGNNSSAISVDTGDRRLYPIQMSNAMIGNVAYFNTLTECMEKQGYAIFHFLSNLDISAYDVRHPAIVEGKRAEDNEFRMRIVEDGLSEPLQYMISIACHEQKDKFIGAQAIDTREGSDEELRFQQSEIYATYCEWYKSRHNNDIKYLCKSRTMATEIEKIGLKSEKRRWKDAEGQTQRTWCYLTNFEQLRDGFRTLLKNPAYDF